MRKYSLIIIALLQSVLFFGQETQGYEVPNFAAKTPEAAAFLKYGEYPVDLSTGVPNISIPLYTVDLGDYKLPISLDYHASGIKVNQEATWVGLGWNLNFGAQVILSVRDDIDENNPYIDQIPDDDAIMENWEQHPFSFNSGIITSENLDRSRVKDVYNFSSPTANGSFYIKDFNDEENGVVVFPPSASFKVELLGASRANMGFIITDNNGNKYLFTNTKEVSARTMTHSDYYISAWYVDKIKTSNNKEIIFEYENDGQTNEYNFSQRVDVKRIGSNACSNLESVQTQVTPIINEGSTTMTSAKKIKEIIFNEGNDKIIFEKLNNREDTGNSNLKFLFVKHKENNVFVYKKGFEFLTSYFTNSGSGPKNKRLKLDSVIDMIDESGHTFEYSNIPLPSKDSKAQDFYGYYNGASQTHMIPRHFISNPYPTVIGGADRRVNPATNQAGILKEIHYPTKGWTKFNYETNQYYGIDKFEKYSPLEVVSGGSLYGYGPGNMDPSNFPPQLEDEYENCIPPINNCITYKVIPFTSTNATGQLTIHATRSTAISNAEMHYKYARVRVFNNMGNLIYNTNKIQDDFTDTFFFNSLTGGTIVMEVYSEYIWIDDLSLQFISIYPDITKNINGAGLRIGSIENYNFDNQLLTEKQYSYTDKSNETISSGKIVNDLAVSFESNIFNNVSIKNLNREYIICDGAVDYTSTYNISSNSRYGIEGNSVIYQYVREKQIDTNNNSDGYTDYEFSTEGDEIPFGNPTVQIYKPWKRGKILLKEDYKISAGVPYLLRKEINEYFDDNSKISYINGFKFWRHCNLNYTTSESNPLYLTCPFNAFRGNCFIPADVFEAYEVVTYNFPIYWNYLKNTTIEERFYNSNNTLTGIITTNKTFNYNNPLHLQLSSVVTESSTGATIETKYFYPQDQQVANEPLMTDLTAKNMIATPILTQNLKAGSKLSEQKTIYKDWGNSLLLPEYIQTSKRNNSSFETRVVFSHYDQFGHPLELKRANGTIVSYIWGYNKTQPIAKIENATNAQIEAALGMSMDAINESNLPNDLRTTLANAMVTTYTYIPLVGVSTITDPKGDTTTYTYDIFGRLAEIKDGNQNVLSENEYHYKD